MLKFKFTVYLVYKLHVYFDVFVTCYFDGSFDTRTVIRWGKKQKKKRFSFYDKYAHIKYFASYFIINSVFIRCCPVLDLLTS